MDLNPDADTSLTDEKLLFSPDFSKKYEDIGRNFATYTSFHILSKTLFLSFNAILKASLNKVRETKEINEYKLLVS